MWIFYRIKDFIRYIPRNIKWFFQRGFRGYSDNDVWDMDGWFLSVIVPMLKQLKETKHGYPCNLTEKEWDNILSKMIFYFEEADDFRCSKQNEYAKSFREITWEDGILNLDENKMTDIEKKNYHEIKHKYFNRSIELDKYRDKKKNQAFILFSKYFWNLWD